MKKIIILLTVVSMFFSCKENEINGFDAESIKKQIGEDLNGTEWVGGSKDAYYEKIQFTNKYIIVTRQGSSNSETVGYTVSNVAPPTELVPAIFVLRIRTGLPTDELYLAKDYSTLQSVIKTDAKSTEVLRANFYLVK